MPVLSNVEGNTDRSARGNKKIQFTPEGAEDTEVFQVGTLENLCRGGYPPT